MLKVLEKVFVDSQSEV
jgi:hypothetical protein